MATSKAKKKANTVVVVRKRTSRKKPLADAVSIRMYCIGTGDCFILKFFDKDRNPFTMMIDCGSCRGDGKWFTPYVEDLATYVNHHIDLLVVTHEHQDHVNGFAKCASIFEQFTFGEAWFAWTENPQDPNGAAAELQKKRSNMKAALHNAVTEIKKRGKNLEKSLANNVFKKELSAAQSAFVNGLDLLAEINLSSTEGAGQELAGMKKIKEILEKKKVKIRYLNPGDTLTVKGMPDIRFHVLGPPMDRGYIFKDGKEGTDVFKKNMALNESALAANAFNAITGGEQESDLPFAAEYIVGDAPSPAEQAVINAYSAESWRTVDDEWLMSAGSLALRLNSHINNTSLALAIESARTDKVLLMPGDAEFGSWESWHMIKKWDKKGKDGKHFVEDLLNRTAFYKVGHHLSYNGTALAKGIDMMPGDDLVAMATLDRNRISEGWKSTMPNKLLVQELIRKTGGRFFIMDEEGITNAPSLTLDPATLGESVYNCSPREDGGNLYKQYTLKF